MSLEGVWARRFGGWRAACRCGESIIERMVIDMNEAQVRTLERVRQVVAERRRWISFDPARCQASIGRAQYDFRWSAHQRSNGISECSTAANARR